MNPLHEPHIVYIITKLELGGAQKVCLSLFESLSSQKRASLITSGEGYFVNRVADSHDVYFLKSLKREIRLKSFLHEISTFFSLIKLLRALKKKHGAIIVHTHSTKAGILGRWAAFFARASKRVHTVHGFGFNDQQNYALWSIIYVCELLTSFITTKFICVSSHDVSVGKSLLPSFGKKYTLIRAAVDWEKFYRPAIALPSQSPSGQTASVQPRKTFVFGTVSCFKPQKNLADLIEAFYLIHRRFVPMYRYNALTLCIIGDGVMRPEIEALINSYKLTHAITLLGWQDDVCPIMKQWDAFVMSSLWEGLPCAIVEARLLKLPVAAYRVGGISDVIIQGKNGFLAEPKDWHGLALAMENLLHNKKEYLAMRSYEDNLTDFQNSIMIEKHNQLYRELL